MAEGLTNEGTQESAEQQIVIDKIRELEPTGDLLHDLKALAGIKKRPLEYTLINQVTGEQFADPNDPEAVYSFYTTPERRKQLEKTYTDPFIVAHVDAVRRILNAYKPESPV